MECLEDIYMNTVPSVDLKEIIKSGETKKDGWFDNYIISEEKLIYIIEEYISRYKLGKHEADYIRSNIYLGPCPQITYKTPL